MRVQSEYGQSWCAAKEITLYGVIDLAYAVFDEFLREVFCHILHWKVVGCHGNLHMGTTQHRYAVPCYSGGEIVRQACIGEFSLGH